MPRELFGDPDEAEYREASEHLREQIARARCIVEAMSSEERATPSSIDAAAVERIAWQAWVSEESILKLLHDFAGLRERMRRLPPQQDP